MPGKSTAATAFKRQTTPGKGVTERHDRACGLSLGKKKCTCSPAYDAVVGIGARTDRQRFTKTFGSLDAALDWADAVRRNGGVNAQMPEQSPVPTIREAANTFTERMTAGDVLARGGKRYSAATIENYAGALSRHVLPFHAGKYGIALGDLPADRVDQRLIEEMAHTLAAEGERAAVTRAKAARKRAKETDRDEKVIRTSTGTATARLAVAALRQVLGDLYRRSLLDAVPAPLPQGSMPAPPKARDRRIGMDEADRAVRAAYADDERMARSLLGPFVMLATRIGGRRNELMMLRWGGQGVRITPTVDDDGQPVLGDDAQPIYTGSVTIGRDTTKTDAGARTVAIDPGMAGALHRHRIATGNPEDGQYVFGGLLFPANTDTTPRPRVDMLRSGLGRISDATRIAALGTHLFRHSVASWAVEAGTDHIEVAARLGHSDPSFTLRTYAHPDRDRIAREPLNLPWEQVAQPS